MKSNFKIIVFAFLLTTYNAFSQNELRIDTANARIYLEKVVKCDSSNSEVIYKRIRSFLSSTYNDSKNVIQLDDFEQKHLILKGGYSFIPGTFVGSACTYFGNYTLEIFVKDGRFKEIISLDNIECNCPRPGGYYKYTSSMLIHPGWGEKRNSQNYIEHFQEYLNKIIPRIESSSSKKLDSEKSDW